MEYYDTNMQMIDSYQMFISNATIPNWATILIIVYHVLPRLEE